MYYAQAAVLALAHQLLDHNGASERTNLAEQTDIEDLRISQSTSRAAVPALPTDAAAPSAS
jgi:hypothetical protein